MTLQNSAKFTAAALVIALSLISPALAQDFTATAVQSIPEQPTQSGLIAKSGQMMRLEFEQDGKMQIKILRPAEGLVLLLDPETQTYLEFTGPASTSTSSDPTTPCPATAQDTQGLICERSGSDVTVSGVQTERWLVGYTQQQPQIILWDPARKQALRQEFPDGSLMNMTFLAMENISGHQSEHWSVELSAPGQEPLTGGWWFEPILRIVIREDMPDGSSRVLENIQAGPVDPSLFEVPSGWQKQELVATPPPANE